MHFFTDFDLLNNQALTQSFGAIPTSPSNKYRITNLFSSSAESNAYAICDGYGFIQENIDNSNTVNFIFMPEKTLFEGCVEIKYFIYRGLKKSSFLASNGNVLQDNPSQNSDLLNKMWQTKKLWNDEKLSVDPNYIPQELNRKDFGLNEIGQAITDGETIIDNAFFANNFQKIKEGFSLGKFNNSNFGIQVVTDTNYSFLKFKDVRNIDHVIEVSSSFPNAESLAIKSEREKILNFIDYVTLLGLSFKKMSVKAKNSNGSVSEYQDNSLATLINKFINKKAIYLDIRNEYNFSLNFFNNYSAGNFAFINIPNQIPYHDGYGWPIIKLNDVITDTNNGKHKLQISFPNGDNSHPICFLKKAILFDKYPADNEKFIIPDNTTNFAIPKFSNNVLLPYYLNIGYCRRYDVNSLPSVPSNPPRYFKDNFLDNMFVINNIEFISEDGFVTYSSFLTNYYSGWSSLVGFDFIGKSGTAKDSIGTTYYSFFINPVELEGSSSYSSSFYDLNIFSGKKRGKSFYLVLQDILKYITLTPYNIVGNSGVYKSFLIHSLVDNISNNIQSYSADNLMSCSITKAEQVLIKGYYNNFNQNCAVFIVLDDYFLNQDNEEFPFFEFTICLQGIKNNGQIAVDNTGIKVYSTNGRMFMSNSYAQELQLLIQ